MENPTLVFLTDRNDLNDQLFCQFQRWHEILRQTPVQADSVEHLRKLLNAASGGVVFTTIQNSCRKRKAAQRRSSPSAGTALERSDSQAHFQTHSRSKSVARPCPTPTQSDAIPREAPVRAIWWISVVARRAPLQPSG